MTGMSYLSTRGAAPRLDFGDVLLAGLARDGGLYLPERWPVITPEAMARYADASYGEVAVDVMFPFVEGSLDRDQLTSIVADAYSGFDHPDVAPLVALEDGTWLLELFHGPTLAFKDVALQLVGPLFAHELAERGETITIVGATSGDTGSAAIEACRDREGIEIFILHPEGRTSEIQRRQMTTVTSPNVHNLAVEGNFDDCQALVKGLFGDVEFRDRHRLSAVNSINWARVMAQIVYYVTSVARLTGGRSPVSFSVPTGNFGNVFAGWAAGRMGVPIDRLVIGSNRNDVLPRWLETGRIEATEVHPTISPSMDIQVSSNHERLVFELLGRDGAATAEIMLKLSQEGSVELPPEVMGQVRERWAASSFDDEETRATIASVHASTGMLVDPHTAVGVAAARSVGVDTDVPMVCLATAHPAKFPDAVEEATGVRPPLPPKLAHVFELEERYDLVPNDLDVLRRYVDERV